MTEKITLQRDEAPIAPARLHHIAFRTARYQQMQEFYRILLGVHPTLEVQSFQREHSHALESLRPCP